MYLLQRADGWCESVIERSRSTFGAVGDEPKG